MSMHAHIVHLNTSKGAQKTMHVNVVYKNITFEYYFFFE